MREDILSWLTTVPVGDINYTRNHHGTTDQPLERKYDTGTRIEA